MTADMPTIEHYNEDNPTTKQHNVTIFFLPEVVEYNNNNNN